MSKQKNQKDKVINVGIKPLGDRVLIEDFDSKEESRTASGIIIPVGVGGEDETKKGKVIAVGPGSVIDGKLVKPEVSVGDLVLYTWGDKIQVEGKKYVLVGSANISAILSE
ncbi:MAG TPA: co-chaperone GroES [Candidatus Paceibacterota bacterium]|nr:co-chaperone GroES [Candidatus Paceibacterota bacterium]HMP19096.1 co-chaperone GroES [Candidatus Paceibacterota bacterium]HMP85100.1 co-chaperone GroES [Candidatus Paceibacterota bacterium]